jgi:hypothetical protein
LFKGRRRASGGAQVVEYLPGKDEALSSNAQYHQRERKKGDKGTAVKNNNTWVWYNFMISDSIKGKR